MADDREVLADINEWWTGDTDEVKQPVVASQEVEEPAVEQPKEEKPKFPKEVSGYSMLGLSILLKQRVLDYIEGKENLDKIKEDLTKFKEIIDGVEQ